MKIAINTTSAVSGGGVTYLKNFLNSLVKAETTHQYLILTTVKGKEMFYVKHPNFKFLSFRIPSVCPILRVLWEQFILPLVLKREGVDVLFSPANICPLFYNTPNVIMIQNLEPFNKVATRTGHGLQTYRLRLLRVLTILSIKRARKIIFISRKAIRDMENLGIPLKHAHLIYHGKNDSMFHSNVDDEMRRQIVNKYNLNKFILYVSNIYRYKNFFELIKAFSMIHNKIDNEIQLILVGRCFDRDYYNEMTQFIQEKQIEKKILFLGEIPYNELSYIYTSCMLFVYPSTCENCPNILIEAMACGTPIIASNIEPMPEICIDAAIYFDPSNPLEISETILRAITDQALLSALREKSLKRVKNFSWEEATKQTLKVFESLFE